jgi:hypothetical protein
LEALQVSFRFLNNVVLSLTALAVAGASGSNAATVVLNATDSGWFRQAGQNGNAITPNNQNFFVGTISQNFGGGTQLNNYRNFFVFDLAGISGTILSASLQILNNGSYDGAAGTYTVYDVTASLATLDGTYLDGDSVGQAVYNDLGSGTVYGLQGVDSTSSNTFVNVSFGSSGISALNAAVGNLLIVGGDLPLGGAAANKDMFYNAGSRQLVLTTQDSSLEANPEPGTLILLGTGLIGSAFFTRRRRKS